MSFQFNLFLTLPSKIIITLFTGWLNMNDISKLDRAINNKAQRDFFLTCLTSNMFLFEGYEYKNLNIENYMNWLITRKISIKRLVIGEKKIYSTETLIELIRMNPNIQSIEFEDNNVIMYCTVTNKIINEISNYCKELVYLKLLQCNKINDVGFKYIANKLTGLKKLNMRQSKLNDAALIKIAIGCKDLLEFDLSHCEKITDTGIIGIAENLTNLEDLNIAHNPEIDGFNYITDKGINNIAIKLLALKKLDLTDSLLTDISLIKIAQNLFNLQYLDLTWCRLITDESIIKIAEKLTNLQYLNLSHNQLITEESIFKISENLINLRELNLSYCDKVSDESLISISENLNHLQDLDLTCCREITDKGVIKIADNLVELEKLSLSSCHFVSNASVSVISENLSNLKHLNLDNCYKITDEIVIKIALNLSNLQYLNLRYCKLLTDESIYEVAINLFNLKELNLLNCDNWKITRECIYKSISNINVNLKILYP
jgi:hypothetical protein